MLSDTRNASPILRFRNSAKAIIIEDGRLLAICRDDPKHGPWYLLPGGGQEPGESLHEALRRETMEEASIEIEIGDLALVREYIGANHEFAHEDGDLHQVELMFMCRRRPGPAPASGAVPDTRQIGVEWLALDRLAETEFYPKSLAPLLARGADRLRREPVIYMGDVN